MSDSATKAAYCCKHCLCNTPSTDTTVANRCSLINVQLTAGYEYDLADVYTLHSCVPDQIEFGMYLFPPLLIYCLWNAGVYVKTRLCIPVKQ